MLIGLATAGASGVVAALAILLVLRYAPALGLVQSPNARSSHQRPTPTGGGIGIVAGAILAGLVGLAEAPQSIGVVFAAGLLLAAIGLWDDVRDLPALWRLAAEIVLVALTLVAAVPFASLAAAIGLPLPVPVLLTLLTVAIVYWLNLFNFMDGIDGIAGSEAVFLLLAPLCLAMVSTVGVADSPFFWWTLALAVATLVFLGFNWQPARIFMGDVGSLFLGFMAAIFAVLEVASGWVSLWEILILFACFAVDGTVTLATRALQREAVLTAHRRHAYQRLARRFGSHQRVVLALLGINLVWLLPLAFAAHLERSLAPLLTVIAYAPLAAGAMLAGAGRPEHA